MGNIISKGNLFPPELTNRLIDLVRGKSSLAILSQSQPLPFNGETEFTFSLDNEVDLVAENAAKTNGGGTVGTITMQPVKVEYGMRISDEFKYAAEEIQLQYLQTFADGFAKKVARGLDIMAFHGVNPRTGLTASSLANKNFDDVISNTVVYDASAPQDNVVAAVQLVEAAEHEVSGMAMAPAFKSALASLRATKDSNAALFPQLGWGARVNDINGLPVDANSTVNFNSNADRAIVGNFADFFKWGIARQIPVEVIEYGNPDNSDDGDLKGHNQIYLRGEAYIGWGILIPEAFAIVKSGASA